MICKAKLICVWWICWSLIGRGIKNKIKTTETFSTILCWNLSKLNCKDLPILAQNMLITKVVNFVESTILYVVVWLKQVRFNRNTMSNETHQTLWKTKFGQGHDV